MRIEGISRIGSVDPLSNVTQVAALEALPTAKSAVGQPAKNADQLVIGSKVPIAGLEGIVDAYARIRFDEESHTVLIQIINSANNEVIREIPPGAWERLKENLQFPTGMLVGSAPKAKAAGGGKVW